MPRAVIYRSGLRLYRLRYDATPNPIVEWRVCEDDPMDPHLRIRFASGHELIAPIPKKTLSDAGVVVLYGASRVPGIPLLSADPDADESDLTDRRDIVALVNGWVRDYLEKDTRILRLDHQDLSPQVRSSMERLGGRGVQDPDAEPKS